MKQLGGAPTWKRRRSIYAVKFRNQIGNNARSNESSSIDSHSSGVIKSSNFLIQSDFSTRLSSFETFVVGKNVYSLGILILEIITRKKPSMTNLG
uniref:Uncharacterized protein n=1 Tax=Lactuca sativa TaxID=4236 RepID=A0A9R1X9K6_LACSA|nr:hypothetical protein LSAT_V11C600308330 [Lactuca sativa]